MQQVKTGKEVGDAIAQCINLSLARRQPAGIESRAHNFVEGDIPVMLHHAGMELPDPTPLQKTLLDMPAKDFIAQAQRNYHSAAEILGWSSPHQSPEVRRFMGDGNFNRSEVRGLLENYEQTHDQFISPSALTRMNAVIINDPSKPLDADSFQTMTNYQRSEGTLISGMTVTLNDDPKQVEHKIEATILSSAGGVYYNINQKLEGFDEPIGSEKMRDARELNHIYGVILQYEGQTYAVQIDGEKPNNPHVGHPVREVAGIAGSYMQHIGCKSLTDAVIMDKDKNHNIPAACGEFILRSMRGRADPNGPCVVAASPWQSSPDSQEMEIALRLVQAFIAKHERDPDVSVKIASNIDTHRPREQEQPGPKPIMTGQMAANILMQGVNR